jgi:hypothetical protein
MRNRHTSRMALVANTLLSLSVAAMLNAAEPSQNSEHEQWSCHKLGAKVHVSGAGLITLNGETVAAAELARTISELSPKPSEVCYVRGDPQGEPPPEALEALEAIMAVGLPVALFTDATFSQRIGADGRPIPRP